MKTNPIVKRTVRYSWDVIGNNLNPHKKWVAICPVCQTQLNTAFNESSRKAAKDVLWRHSTVKHRN
jgi:hypothetical protein